MMSRSSLKRHMKYTSLLGKSSPFSFSCDPPCKKKFQTLQGLLAHKKRLNACKAGKENNCPEHVQGSIAQHIQFCSKTKTKRKHQRLERKSFEVRTCIYFRLMWSRF